MIPGDAISIASPIFHPVLWPLGFGWDKSFPPWKPKVSTAVSEQSRFERRPPTGGATREKHPNTSCELPSIKKVSRKEESVNEKFSMWHSANGTKDCTKGAINVKYISVKEAASLWGISIQMVRRYCREGQITDAVQEDGIWYIPMGVTKPGKQPEPEIGLPHLVKRIRYQRERNNHFGIYEYIQIELAYHSNRMASNRLTRKQVEEVYRTGKVTSAFEPMKVDDLVETVNHFCCVREMIDTVMQPLSVPLIKRYHTILTTGTTAALDGSLHPGSFRTAPSKLGLPPQDISRSLTNLLHTYEHTPTDLTALLQFHINFEQIHPFSDYNGRLGRILLLKESLRHEIIPFIYQDKSRGAYNRSIRDRDLPALLTLTTHAQERFKRKEELCRLMRYHRY